MSGIERTDAFDLLIYTKCFATMLGADVSLQRCLDILTELSDDPLKTATGEMRKEICENSRILSAVMRERPELFTPMYVAIVYAGEVGGILDETMAQVADLLESDWIYCQETGQKCRSLLFPWPQEEQRAFAESSFEERLRILSQYFRALGMMLTAGVPLGEGRHNALLTAAQIFPPGPERDALEAIAPALEERPPSHVLPRHFDLPFVPPWALQLISIGSETPTLPQMCEKIAQLLEYQRKYYLLKNRK